MKKSIMIVIATMFLSANVFAGGVTDNNSGNSGDILVSTGENNGANSIGTWTDPSFLKGEKGDTGATGATGETGAIGENGLNGVDGQNGKDGVKGDTGKGLRNPVELQAEAVVKETKNTAWSLYYIHDFNNDIDTVGAKVKVYVGKSYSEQVREDLQKQIDELKNANTPDLVSRDNVVIVPTSTGFKTVHQF